MNGIGDRLTAEVRNREGIQDEMSKIQSQLNHLATSIPNPMQPLPPTCTVASNNGITAQNIVNTGFNMNNTLPPNPICPPSGHSVPIGHPTTQLPPNYNLQFTVPGTQLPATHQTNPFRAHVSLLMSQMSSLQERFSNSENNLNEMFDEIADLKAHMNDRDQYDRRNNGVLHGLDDVPILPRKPTQDETKAFTQYVVDKVNKLFPGIEGGFTARDIDDTHIFRTKKSRSNSHHQLIIIRFCSRLVRNEIFSRKKELKGTGCALTEHLTKYNLELLKAAQKRLHNVKKAWTHYGKVLIDLNGTIKSIRNYNDLDYYTQGANN